MKARFLARVGGILALIFLVTGCFDGYQMNQLAIINALAIDYHRGEYMATAEAFNTTAVPSPGHPTGTSVGGGNPSAGVLLTGAGKTVGEAMANLSGSSSRHVFWAATTVVIIGSEALKKGLTPIAGSFLRFPEFRTTARVFVAKSEAAPLLSGKTSGMEISIGQEIRNQDRFLRMDISRGWAPRAYDVLRWDTQHGRSAVLLGIQKTSSNPTQASQFSMGESAVIGPNGRLQGWLPGKATTPYLWLVHRSAQAFSSLKSPSGVPTTIYWTHVTSRVSVRVRKGQVAGVDIMLTGAGKVAGTLPNRLRVINQLANKKAVAETLATVHWAEQHDADIFGWGQAVYRKNPRLWYGLHGSWPGLFKTLPVSVHSKIVIVQGGAGRV